MKVEGTLRVTGTYDKMDVIIQGNAEVVVRFLNDIKELRSDKKRKWNWTNR